MITTVLILITMTTLIILKLLVNSDKHEDNQSNDEDFGVRGT